MVSRCSSDRGLLVPWGCPHAHYARGGLDDLWHYGDVNNPLNSVLGAT